MKCQHDKIHNKLSYATLRHLTGLLDETLKEEGIKNAAKRQSICGSFIFHASYFLDNQWVKFGKNRYRTGFCFQEFAKDAFAPTQAIVTDYKDGEMLHEAAWGISDSRFEKDAAVGPTFQKIGDVYDEK